MRLQFAEVFSPRFLTSSVISKDFHTQFELVSNIIWPEGVAM